MMKYNHSITNIVGWVIVAAIMGIFVEAFQPPTIVSYCIGIWSFIAGLFGGTILDMFVTRIVGAVNKNNNLGKRQ